MLGAVEPIEVARDELVREIILDDPTWGGGRGKGGVGEG